MPWHYNQRSGKIVGPGGEEYQGYSGRGVHKNEPRSEAIVDSGPIPRGTWRINPDHYDSATLGPFVLKLSPVGHSAHGRTHFRVHGDKAGALGTASKGCIVLSREARKAMVRSGETTLEVR